MDINFLEQVARQIHAEMIASQITSFDLPPAPGLPSGEARLNCSHQHAAALIVKLMSPPYPHTLFTRSPIRSGNGMTCGYFNPKWRDSP
jgi:hypothetical protein